MSELPPMPNSPGVGARRKGPKGLPTLPLSAFSAPNSSASDSFPIPQSPITTHPSAPVDAYVTDIEAWRTTAGEILGGKSGSVILLAQEGKGSNALEAVSGKSALGALVPLSSDAPSGVHYTTVYSESTSSDLSSSIRSALEKGKTVDITVQTDLLAGDAAWEALEDLTTKVTSDGPSGKLILSNILPPRDDLGLPIVKLLTHPTYQRYQAHVTSLSLISGLHLAFRPPSWGAAVPAANTKEFKEWKRRIKMYIGPCLEAFGFERLVFGSAPTSGDAASSSTAEAWYHLAYESFAELGVEQDAIDAVFGGNAKKVFAA